MSDLLNKLRKNTTIKDSDILADSKFFNAKDMVRTTVPAINIALSGKINGGFENVERCLLHLDGELSFYKIPRTNFIPYCLFLTP